MRIKLVAAKRVLFAVIFPYYFVSVDMLWN